MEAEAELRTSCVSRELPDVAVTVQPAERVEVVTGDFFNDPLPQADAYVMMLALPEAGSAASPITPNSLPAPRSNTTLTGTDSERLHNYIRLSGGTARWCPTSAT